MLTRERVRSWLCVLGVIALFLAVMPYFHYEGGTTATAAKMKHLQANPGDMPRSEEFRFGWADSPLAHYRSQLTLTELPDGGFTGKRAAAMTIGWMSWSSLTLAIGIGLLWVARKLRPASPRRVVTGDEVLPAAPRGWR
jgi:hypothetical protein